MTDSKTKKTVLFVLGTVVLLVSFLLAARRYSEISGYKHVDVSFWQAPSLKLELLQFLGIRDFHGQFGQDKWVLGGVFPGVKDGYFVDIGSWDAVEISNSKALEEAGWTGICMDPFPRNWNDRTCQLFKEVVYSKAGETVEFRMADVLGGIDEHLEAHRDAVKDKPTKSFTTTTIEDVLKRAGAPQFIHYLSIDTEGSEFEILRVFPFSEYTIGALTVEHNDEEPKRQQIRDLLESHGFRYVREMAVDDWYVHKDSDPLR